MNSEDILHRRNLRGLAKCKECNHFNGNRAIACKNKFCSLSQVKLKRKQKPKLDTVQLITKDESQLYSVQMRDRDVENRNFVSITDKIISSDEHGSIISRNAICYIDTCKYDSNDVNISCKHVKSSMELGTTKSTPLEIKHDVLNAMSISADTIDKFWKLYTESELTMPLVQRINQTIFVVRCGVSQNFPAGLLHLIFNSEGVDPSYSCACKKMRILMSPNQSIILEKDACDHILQTFAAIMSNPVLREEFKLFMPAIKPFFKKNFENISIQNDAQHIDYSSIDFENFSTKNLELSTNSNNTTISATLIESLDNIELIPIPNVSNDVNDAFVGCDNTMSVDFPLMLGSGDDANEMQSVKMENIPIINHVSANDGVNLDGIELIDFKVELMDSLKFTDQIELCDEEIPSNENHSDYLGMEGIYDMADINCWSNESSDVLNLYQNDSILIGESSVNPPIATNFGKIKSKKISSGNKLPANQSNEGNNCDNSDDNETVQNPADNQIFLNWLDSVIERINLTMDFNDGGRPGPLMFSVPNIYFNMLRIRFSVGTKKKRLPSQTTLIKEGKYKGLTLSSWMFCNIKLIKYIFSTHNMSIEVMRSFSETSAGNFKYIEAVDSVASVDFAPNANDARLRKIRPTIYKTFLKAKSTDDIRNRKISDKYGLFVIEWIPNVLPKSKYGEMRIKLQFGHMKNDNIIDFQR